jgi:urease accessory protein
MIDAPAHMIALVALGLLIGQQPTSHRIALLAAFAASLIAGILLIVAAFAVTDPDIALLYIAAFAGLAVAVAHRWSIVVAWPLALIAGVAIELDSVPQEISMAKTLAALAGTAIAAFVIVAALSTVAPLLRRGWQRIGIRVVGSWIAASAILVLALQLAR